MSGLTRRQSYERAQRRRSIAIAAASTAAVVGVLVIGVPRLAAWPRVRDAFFNREIFRTSFEPILRAFWLDVKLFVICGSAVLIVGMLVALARSVRSPALFPLRFAATVYTDVVRGVPLILWLFLIGFGTVGLINSRSFFGGYLFWGGVALVITYSAYVAEVLRAGIESVHESQRAGARSLGLTTWQTNRHVVLPQAVRRVVPPLVNDYVSMQKDVALVSVLGPVEALRRADIIQDRTFNFTPFVVAALLFLSVSIPLIRIADRMLARQRRETSGTVIR